MTCLFWGIGLGIVLVFRWWAGWEPLFKWQVITVVATLTAAPIGFLAGIGAFDYWARYATGAPTQPEDHSTHGGRNWRDYFRPNTDHKVIGIQYLVTTIVFFIAGGLMAMLFRAELARPGMQFVDNQTFNGLVSVHAALMIFLFVIPAFAGLGNYVIPLMIGAPDMAFPRLNALSFWLLPIAGTMMLLSFLVPGGAFAAGWTGYAPLSVDQPLGTVFFNMGVQWAGASSIMTALNFLVTIITMRAPGMTFWRMPLLVWANFTTSLLVVIATPFIAGSQFFVMFDRVMHTNFFDAANGGYVLGYQHIFWFYSHPAVYIMMLPGFGIASEVISAMARKPIFGYRLMALEPDGDPHPRVLRLGAPHVRRRRRPVAAHPDDGHVDDHRRPDRDQGVLVVGDDVGGPHTLRDADAVRARLRLDVRDRRPVGHLPRRRCRSTSTSPTRTSSSRTSTTCSSAVPCSRSSPGIYYWFPKMTGRMYNEKLGKLHFWMTFIGFNITFFPMHWLGTQGMPRRVSDYAPRFADWNMAISIASFFLGASTIIFLYNMITSWIRGPRAEANPWRAKTLEWQVSSPPPYFNFDEIPQVVGHPYEYGVPGAQHAVFNGDRVGELEEVHH